VDVRRGVDVSRRLACLRDTRAAGSRRPHILSLSLKGCERAIGSVWVCITKEQEISYGDAVILLGSFTIL